MKDKVQVYLCNEYNKKTYKCQHDSQNYYPYNHCPLYLNKILPSNKATHERCLVGLVVIDWIEYIKHKEMISTQFKPAPLPTRINILGKAIIRELLLLIRVLLEMDVKEVYAESKNIIQYMKKIVINKIDKLRTKEKDN